MRWLANENFPGASIRLLRTGGHDVAAIIEDAPGSEDTGVLARGASERRIILTYDRDYGELIFHRRLASPAGLLYFRYEPPTPEEPAARIQQLLNTPGLVLEGMFTTVERDHLRQRHLP